MKIMRKILALVLVLASLASFVLVAGAAKFSDARNITHASAVDVLVGLGVVNGYENGTFKPTSSVTRAEMAKMLSFVLNGGKDVGDMYAGACTFADSASHWAKGYIGYCVTMGLINGKSATRFAPDDKVTGYEAAKMMLCALGYKADLNGLTGSQWNTNAHTLGVKAKLFTLLVDYTPTNPLNRDDACQMIMNTLRANMVETTGTITEIEGIVITNEVKNTVMINSKSVDYAGRTDEDLNVTGNQNYLQLVENCFPDLKLSSGNNDSYGRPCDVWTRAGAVISSASVSTAVHKADGSSTTGAKVAAAINGSLPLSVSVYRDGKLVSSGDHTMIVDELTKSGSNLSDSTKAAFTANRDDVSMIISLVKKQGEIAIRDAFAKAASSSGNGQAAGAAHVLTQIWRGHTESLRYYYLDSGRTSGAAYGSRGSRVEVYYDETTQHLTICWGYYYYGKVVGIRPEQVDANGTVIVPAYYIMNPIKAPGGTFGNLVVDATTTIPGSSSTVPVLVDRVSSGEEEIDVKVGDYLAYATGNDRTVGTLTVEYAIPVQTVTTALMSSNQYSNGSYDYRIRAKDKTYYYYTVGDQILHQIGPAYKIYFAKIGSSNIFFTSEGNTNGYAYLYNAGEKTPSIVQTFQAKLVKADGSIEIVETDKNYQLNVGSVVTYVANTAGKTVLTPVGSYSGNFDVKATINNSNSTVTFDGVQQTADTKTTFVIGTTDAVGNESFTVYKGIAKVPSTTATQYYAYVLNDAGALDTVFLINASGMTSATQEGVLFKTGLELTYTGEFGDYYVVQAIQNNEVTTMKLLPAAYNQLNATGFTLFNSYTADANGFISGINKINGTALTAFTPAQNGNIVLNTTPYTYNNNVLVYTYSILNQTLAISNVESLMQMNTTQYTSFYTLHELYENKPLAAIFMVID